MTEDEVFIRAIVDSPGDDTPRLVYADWLDDRGDPRGPYLRAETDWARTRRKKKPVLELAATLEDLWVARVSRPPVGVCCEHLAKSKGDRDLEPDELDAAADDLGVDLPLQLRALLLNYNPGHLRGGPFVLPTADRWPRIAVLEFVDLNGQNPADFEIGNDLVERTFYLRQDYEFPDDLLYLASGVEFEHFVVSGKGTKAGSVYLVRDNDIYLHGEADEAVRLAKTIGEFLHQLVPRYYPLGDE